MNSVDLQNAIKKIEPDDLLKERIRDKATEGKGQRKPIRYAVLASGMICVILIACVSIYTFREPLKPQNTTTDSLIFMIYKGCYFTSERIDYNKAKELMGDKLGTTALNELNRNAEGIYIKDADKYSDFTSNGPIRNVYKVKGYDEKIMLIAVGDKSANIFSLNPYGMTFRSGSEWLDKFNIKDNISSAEYYANISSTVAIPFKDITTINNFVNSLYDAKQHSYFEASAIPSDKNYKVIDLKLKNGLIESLYLQEGGFVYFRHITFEMDKSAFENIWSLMK